MKKFYIYILFFVFASITINAQNKDTKRADKLFNSLAYPEAIEEYTRILKQGKGGTYVYTQLAKSYTILNDTKQAESYYKKAAKSKKADPEVVYSYAQILKANGKLEEHLTWMRKFVEKKPSDSRAQLFSSNPDYLSKLSSMEPGFIVENAGELNTELSDFGSFVKDNVLYFSSARNNKRKSHNLNDEPFLDVYSATIDGSSIGSPELLPGNVNTKYHEGVVAISPDGNRMYFDRNDYFKNGISFLKKAYGKSSEGVNQINLYTAEKVSGNWENIQPVVFNDSEYSTGHPALSPDGKTLYFSSDKPGGKGGSDIYRVSVGSDGTLGIPEIVPGVNTEGTEVFPFVASDGTLYFSSNGHLGIGGLDVFSVKPNGGSYSAPENLGPGANSSSDDFAIYLNPETMRGYISSNRSGGKGGDDIYSLEQLPPCEVDATLIVENASGEAIPRALIKLVNVTEGTTDTNNATTAGTYPFISNCNTEYTVTVSAEGYESETRTITIGNEKVSNNPFTLEKIVVEEPIVTTTLLEGDTSKPEITATEVILNPIYFDFDKWNIRPDAAAELDRLVAIMNENPTMVISAESHTDSRGPVSYNQTLSEKRANSMRDYVVSKGINNSRVSGIGIGESSPAITCEKPQCTEAEYQLNRRCVFKIIKR